MYAVSPGWKAQVSMATNVTREPRERDRSRQQERRCRVKVPVPASGSPDESVQRLRFYGILSFVWGVPDYGIGHSILETSCKQCKRFSKFVKFVIA